MLNDVLSFMAECEECKANIKIASDDVSVTHKREFYTEDGRTLYLTYYDCPVCGKRHFVQVDDERSLKMLEENKKQFFHNAALKTTGKKLRKKKVDQYKSTKTHLANYRTILMKELSGIMLHDDVAGTDFVLRFSV